MGCEWFQHRVGKSRRGIAIISFDLHTKDILSHSKKCSLKSGARPQTLKSMSAKHGAKHARNIPRSQEVLQPGDSGGSRSQAHIRVPGYDQMNRSVGLYMLGMHSGTKTRKCYMTLHILPHPQGSASVWRSPRAQSPWSKVALPGHSWSHGTAITSFGLRLPFQCSAHQRAVVAGPLQDPDEA